MARAERGDVWLTDLGLAAKVRPCLILNVPPSPRGRMLITLAPHTTSVRGSSFEIAVPKPFLRRGAFDGQGIITVTPPRLLRRLGRLDVRELESVEAGVRRWLGL